MADGCGVAACLPRMAAGGYRLRMAAGGGSDGVAVGAGSSCLLALVAMDGAARSSLLPPSHRLIQSATIPRGIPSTGRGFLFLFARPPPACSSRFACLGLVPPSPAGGCVGCGMACGGGREDLFACLLSCPCRSLTAFVRSLLYAPCRLRRCVYLWRCGAFYGLFRPLTCRR